MLGVLNTKLRTALSEGKLRELEKLEHEYQRRLAELMRSIPRDLEVNELRGAIHTLHVDNKELIACVEQFKRELGRRCAEIRYQRRALASYRQPLKPDNLRRPPPGGAG